MPARRNELAVLPTRLWSSKEGKFSKPPPASPMTFWTEYFSVAGPGTGLLDSDFSRSLTNSIGDMQMVSAPFRGRRQRRVEELRTRLPMPI